MFKIPANEDICFMDGGQGDMNAVIKAGLTHHILINVLICKFDDFIRYDYLFQVFVRQTFEKTPDLIRCLK